MLLANYASDSEGSDSESGPSKPSVAPIPKPQQPAVAASAPKAKKRTGPVKITLDLPKASAKDKGEDYDNQGDLNDDNDEHDEDRSAKKPKLASKGKGSSALVGMLPPPKRKLPASATGRGNSGLVVNKAMATTSKPVPVPPTAPVDDGDDDDDDDDTPAKPGMLLPSSIARNQAKSRAAAEPEIDLFGLSSSSTPPPKPPTSTLKPPSSISITSAPAVSDYVPPPPTATDPYPGYYQLPSGQWAAYDPEYYLSFFPAESGSAEQTEDGRVGRHWDEFNSKGADMVEIDVGKDLEEARKEEERQKRLVKPGMPGDEYEYKPLGQIKGVAAQRHQLTSLLHNAYSQREELEDRIAQNKKNMRLAGQKYGF
ncbi:mitotic checkpoint regulator, MAD2B-interacting-domain-containing protein [Naematelia encephala]|uniref:Mitotic checkpoint regulator, MAD2B-interacting-domain-containing protein n=1 Tax=Naematelia encephala TaxID=71784 RepID=A0A1Y2AXL7_9TREE|nr:mitotic checkpoint regulator, MAD2B-interacting-domain-containing protein [Naematelia encephala]